MARNKNRDRDRDEDDRPRRAEPVRRDGAYVMMLFITLVAIATGCVLLYLDNEEYGGKSPPKEGAPTVLKLGDAPKDAGTPAAAPGAPDATPKGDAPAPMGGMPPAMP